MQDNKNCMNCKYARYNHDKEDFECRQANSFFYDSIVDGMTVCSEHEKEEKHE